MLRGPRFRVVLGAEREQKPGKKREIETETNKDNARQRWCRGCGRVDGTLTECGLCCEPHGWRTGREEREREGGCREEGQPEREKSKPRLQEMLLSIS